MIGQYIPNHEKYPAGEPRTPLRGRAFRRFILFRRVRSFHQATRPGHSRWLAPPGRLATRAPRARVARRLVLLTQRNGRALKLLEAGLRNGMLLVQCIEVGGEAE